MDNYVLIANRLRKGDVIPHIRLQYPDRVSMGVPNPVQIPLATRSRHRVVDRDQPSLPGEVVGGIHADEAGAARNQHSPAVPAHSRTATSVARASAPAIAWS